MRFLRAIVRHTELKLVALLLAVLLWLHVATNEPVDLDVDYTLHYVNIPDSLTLADPPPGFVTVRMHGPGKTLLRLLWQDRRWPVDLTDVSIGDVHVRLDLEAMPRYGLSQLTVTDAVTPIDFIVALDTVDRKRVPITSAARIECAPGFSLIGDPVLSPDSVLLIGPRRHLRGIEAVRTHSSNLTGARETVTMTLTLVPPPGYNIRLEPQQGYLYQKVESAGRVHR